MAKRRYPATELDSWNAIGECYVRLVRHIDTKKVHLVVQLENSHTVFVDRSGEFVYIVVLWLEF